MDVQDFRPKLSAIWLLRKIKFALFLNVSSPFRFSAYQVVVVEEDGSRQVRRRELGSVDCFPTPNSHSMPQSKVAPHYYTAELAPSSLPEATPFTVGDNHTYNGYWNSPLDPTKNYLIYFQAASNFRGVRTISQCACSGFCFWNSDMWLLCFCSFESQFRFVSSKSEGKRQNVGSSRRQKAVHVYKHM